MKVAYLQMNAHLHQLRPAEVSHVGKTEGRHTGVAEKTTDGRNFGQVLTEKVATNQGIRFSAHAMQRIQENNLDMTVQKLSRLDEGVKQVSLKGARDSLILLDDVAYIVNVKNKMVITAVDRGRATNNVFTNIDSVVIV